MAKRKTADIADIKDEVNRILRGTWPGNTKDFRQGVIVLLENILWAADNYRGYRYLTNLELPGDVEPGVRYKADGTAHSYEERFLNTDTTRRQY